MFEKDAEEKSLEQPFSKDHYYYGFKEGAEFGYNKANEWHYVKDGDLPKEEDKQYLCLIKSWVGGAEVYACLIYNTQYHSWQESYGDVIKWKEIK